MRFFYNLVFEGTHVPALDSKPNLFDDLIWIWDAFCTLSGCRSFGMNGPHAISFSEIQAMSNELEIKGETRTRFFNRMTFLDRIFIEHCQKQTGKK